MDALMLDGNAIAGLLQEMFTVEMTSAVGTCGTCGATNAVGAIHVYRGAGFVLRCPSCDTALMKIVTDAGRAWIDFRGLGALELSR